jgi:hypothetical protein
MKTLVKAGKSIYLFDEAKVVVITADNITVGNPPEFIIGDCSSTNTVLHEGVTAPSDWIGGKYLFDGEVWEINPNWIDPEADVVEEVI